MLATFPKTNIAKRTSLTIILRILNGLSSLINLLRIYPKDIKASISGMFMVAFPRITFKNPIPTNMGDKRMKVLIMAGGYATRLWPITKNKPKPLLPVGNKTIIEHILEKLANIKYPIYVSTNKFFEKSFREKLSKYDVELIVENSYREEEKFGTIAAIKNAIETIGDDDYLIISGDNLFSLSIEDFLSRFDEVKKTLIAVYDIGDFELAKRYGVVVLEILLG
ncbi:putative mannose-1-phosphate guanyltransferase [Pyrococcus furiosus DSM 3638]|uniref:Mannose-1-phosphate guanyltransferase n=3 Tax=Pyrococcus furiosus TaxID=2261 RepID=Q8U3L7_PYRFU|nr:putative mannose-1-phosphate guanyltransferase [Pyrococcus furiosus DSM 3638]